MDYLLILRRSLRAEYFKPIFFYWTFTPWGIPKDCEVLWSFPETQASLPLLSLSLKWKALAFWSEFSSIHCLTITLSCFWSWPPHTVLSPKAMLSTFFSGPLFMPSLSSVGFDIGFRSHPGCHVLSDVFSADLHVCEGLASFFLLCFVARDDLVERFPVVRNRTLHCFAAFQRKWGK